LKNNFTLKDLANLPCADRNQHILNEVVKPNNKLPVQPKSSKALKWLSSNLHYWCLENNLILEKQYKFAAGRKYKSDFAIESLKVLIEFEGGIFMDKAGHNSAMGIQRDIEKYKLAEELGYKVRRYTALNYKEVLQDLSEIKKN
jgi:very-short-patch-repair endonuclease